MAARKRPPAPPKLSLEDQWLAIAENAISEAEGVECSMEEFVEGLETILSEVRERLTLAKDEIKNQKDADNG